MFEIYVHNSIDDWNRYFNDPPTVTNSDGSRQFRKTDPSGKYFVTDCIFGDLKMTCVSVNSVGPNYLGVSETEFNKCSCDGGVPCTVFRNGSFFQCRVTGINCTVRATTNNGIHTSVEARQNSDDLNLIEESSISGYTSETGGAVISNWYRYISFVLTNESNCKTNYNVGYLILNDPSGTSNINFCQFITNEADYICYKHANSQHFIHCTNYLNSSYSSTKTTSPGVIYIGYANSLIYISNSVIKENSGQILLYTYYSNIITDKCFIENPKIVMTASGNGDIQFNNNNIISLCILVKTKYKTILQNKYCKRNSNNSLYSVVFFIT